MARRWRLSINCLVFVVAPWYFTSSAQGQGIAAIHHDISTQDVCEEVTAPPQQDIRWYEGLSLQADNRVLGGDIVAYKIRWFNGNWSGWIVPGVNDIDGTVNHRAYANNKAKHNTLRRMWAMFYDHEHKYIICKHRTDRAKVNLPDAIPRKTDVIAYEPFDYEAGSSIIGANGGIGWDGPWYGGDSKVAHPGLTFSTVPAAGRCLGGTSGSASTRRLRTPVEGTSGTSLFISALFLCKFDGWQATLGNVDGQDNGHFYFGDLAKENGHCWALHSGVRSYYSKVKIVPGEVALLVAQIDFMPGNDRMRLWVNPDRGAPLPSSADIDVTSDNLKRFAGVFWQSQQGFRLQTQMVDEIRIGRTFFDVVAPVR
jgi:hypothetical protein